MREIRAKERKRKKFFFENWDPDVRLREGL